MLIYNFSPQVNDIGVLTIDVVHPRHAGVYQCLASNSFGTLHTTVNIEITRKYSMLGELNYTFSNFY